MAYTYFQELDALQRWLYSVAGLTSMRLTVAPPKVARPIVLWEAPSRRRDRNINRFQYVNQVRQFGKLYAADLMQLLEYQDRLHTDLEERNGILPIYDKEGPAGVVIGHMKAADLEFTESPVLDVPFSIRYEVTYTRTRPPAPPQPVEVHSRAIPRMEG